MDHLQNPFVPGDGIPPPFLTGRDDVFEYIRLTLDRARHSRFAKPIIVTGFRGVGKSVLLAAVKIEAEAAGDICIFVKAKNGVRLLSLLLPCLQQTLIALHQIDKGRQAGVLAFRALAGFTRKHRRVLGDVASSFSFDSEAGWADSGVLSEDTVSLIEATGRAAKQKDTAISVIIDDIHLMDEVSMATLVSALQLISRQNLPVSLLGGGLPSARELANNASPPTDRVFDYLEIGQLKRKDARLAIVEPVQAAGCSISKNAVEEILKLSERYPYFLQAWGHFAWNVASSNSINIANVAAAAKSVERSLDGNFFQVLEDGLTTREINYLRALASLGPGPHRTGDIADSLEMSAQSAAPLRRKLIDKGAISSPKVGYAMFSTPMFDSCLRRRQEDQPKLPAGKRSGRSSRRGR